MAEQLKRLPLRRSDILLVPLDEGRRWVVKNPVTSEYFQLGADEAFLLQHLDGQYTADEICRAFESQRGSPLSADDLREFLELAASQGLLEIPAEPTGDRQTGYELAGSGPAGPTLSQILYWRLHLIDPDRLLSFWAARVRFLWTPAFALLSAALVLLALGVIMANVGEFVRRFTSALGWQMLFWAWLTVFFSTAGHEFAHGLTCKHFGGEVHEMGFLLLFLMPGLYTNVSDSWLFAEKSKRLWVVFAGPFCDLVMWAAAVLLWRTTLEATLVSYLALILFSVTGFRSLLNFNPLIKLDGYYLLSDLVEIPNLWQRSRERLNKWVQRLLWGGPPPESDPRGQFLTSFALASWTFSVLLLGLMTLGLTELLRPYAGPWGLVGGLSLGGWLIAGLFRGFSAGQFRAMLRSRRRWALAWCATVAAVLVALFGIPIRDRHGGPFVLHPAALAEVCAPADGFIKAIYANQGDSVTAGQRLASLTIPDLASRIAQQQAAVREAEAELKLLEAGTRPEKIAEQEHTVALAKQWETSATSRLDRQRQSVHDELVRLDELIAERKSELQEARRNLVRGSELLQRNAISAEDYDSVRLAEQVAEARWQQALSERASRATLGAMETERDLAVFQKELAGDQFDLALMKLGPRPEKRRAAEARLAKLHAELDYLQQLRRRLEVPCPIAGVVVTPYLQEKIGRYLHQGDSICTVEDRSAFVLDISLDEDSAATIDSGQPVGIKLRSLPYESFAATVTRVAPRATQAKKAESQNQVHVYCRLEDPGSPLESDLTGYARIYGPRRPIGLIALDRLVRFFRTEFWW